jgi:hypothetical protein
MSFPSLGIAELSELSEPRCGHDVQGREFTATMETVMSGFERARIHYLIILRAEL